MKVSIIIVTINRKEQLRHTIKSFLAQSYEDKEIIVADNGSSDGTREMLESEFPSIKKVLFPSNFNLQAFNYCASIAKGDILWRCDDDSNLENKDDLAKVVEKFKANSQLGILATEDIEVNLNNAIWHWYIYPVDKINVPINGYTACSFHGTGAGIRKSAFFEAGMFHDFLMEELELSTAILNCGYEIKYFPNIRTHHHRIPSKTIRSTRWLLFTKQIVSYVFRFYPVSSLIHLVPFLLFAQLFQGLIWRLSPFALISGCFWAIGNGYYRRKQFGIKLKPEVLTLLNKHNNFYTAQWHLLTTYFRIKVLKKQ